MKITIDNRTRVKYCDIVTGEWFEFIELPHLKTPDGTSIQVRDAGVFFGVEFAADQVVTPLVSTEFTFEAST